MKLNMMQSYLVFYVFLVNHRAYLKIKVIWDNLEARKIIHISFPFSAKEDESSRDRKKYGNQGQTLELV